MNMFKKIFKRKSKEIYNIADKYLKNDIIDILGDNKEIPAKFPENFM